MNLSLKLAVISLPILLLAFIFPAFAQENSSAIPFSLGQYKIGERLTYNVSFSNFPSAAHVEVEVLARGPLDGRDAITLHGHVQTSGVVNVALFAINNDYTTSVDALTGLPFRSEQVIRQATGEKNSSREFTQATGSAAAQGRQNTLGTYDILSSFYRVRALPLDVGDTYSLFVRGETQNYLVELKVTDKETVKTNVGSFSTIATQVKVSPESPLRSVKVYFSDDERHLPVLVTAKVSTGTLRAELAAIELVVPDATAIPTPTPVIPAASATPTPSQTPSGNGDWPFKIGEELNYQVFIGTSQTPLGLASFKVRARSRFFDRDGLALTVKAQTTGAAARVFVANDQIDTYVDPKALLPYRSEFKLAEGQRRVNQTLTINQDYGTATTERGQKIEIPVGTHDYLSFFYAVRSFNVNPPKRNAVSILVENKPKTLFITSVKREQIQLGDQMIPSIALALTTDDPQSDKYQFRMWVSDDKRRLPLRITCATQLGPLRADLVILPASSH